jgi:hypothetical protein
VWSFLGVSARHLMKAIVVHVHGHDNGQQPHESLRARSHLVDFTKVGATPNDDGIILIISAQVDRCWPVIRQREMYLTVSLVFAYHNSELRLR